MQILIYLSLAIYFAFYIFEGPVRYVLNSVGADFLIFIRDIILIVLLFAVFTKQLIKKEIHSAFTIFIIIIAIHGMVSIINIRNQFVIFYCVKLLMTVVAGAVLAPYLIKLEKPVVKVVFALWLLTFIGVFLDKYFVEYPWTGLGTTIGDIQVEISRDWQIGGADKRAGGFMRSSINVAIIEPLLAFTLLFNVRSFFYRLLIILMTAMVLYWSTQKAAIIAFVFAGGLLIAAFRNPIPLLKAGITLAFIIMVCAPVVLPQFSMPSSNGVFSMGSFYMRVEDIWPAAWKWIEQYEIFPFGVGLGGIGGAQRFYDMDSFNAADNMFIFLYAYFGLFSFIYMGWLWWVCMRISNKPSDTNAQALSIILFIIFYGSAMTIIEDQMGSLFLGVASSWIGRECIRQNRDKKHAA